MPIEGSTTFTDAVFGEITVDNSELQDQILIKTDGYPTYNFANVIDGDLLIPLTSNSFSSSARVKLSKRHGATGFYDLINEGYLPRTT